MKIIDAHMHYFNIEGFKTVAANADMKTLRLAGSRFVKKIILCSAWQWEIRKMCRAVMAEFRRALLI